MATDNTNLWIHGSAIQYSATDVMNTLTVRPSKQGFEITTTFPEPQELDLFLPLPTPSLVADQEAKLYGLHFYYKTFEEAAIIDLELLQASNRKFELPDPNPVPITKSWLPLTGYNEAGITPFVTYWNLDVPGNPPIVGDLSASRGLCLYIKISIKSILPKQPQDDSMITIYGAGIEYIHGEINQ